MCPDRIAAGKQTACAEACPTGATKFGERDELIREAQERIRANPSNYVPHVFGVEEVGGTSVLMLSGIPFDQWNMRLSDLPSDPLPLYTYKVLSRIPDFIPLGGIVLGGVWWITHRRDEVAEAEAAEQASKEAGKKNGGAR